MAAIDVSTLVRALPKAELHLHIEGTLEPELMLRLAERNDVALPWTDPDAVRAAYEFADLSSFLDLYYAGMSVLLTEQDFYDLTWSYITRAAQDDIVHVELFFDPQAHSSRGVPFGIAVTGILLALEDAEEDFGITSRLIACILRDRPVDEAEHVLSMAHRYREHIAGIGLDSTEAGYPPSLFASVFETARSYGMHVVAHAGEEGPPSYIEEALDVLHVERIDHGVRCIEEPALVQRLAKERVPLTTCPLSNVRLGIYDSLSAHPLKRLLDAGVLVTVNSDDPAYFGGYLVDNYVAVAEALSLTPKDIVQLVKNSFEASFLSRSEKDAHIAKVERVAAGLGA